MSFSYGNALWDAAVLVVIVQTEQDDVLCVKMGVEAQVKGVRVNGKPCIKRRHHILTMVQNEIHAPRSLYCFWNTNIDKNMTIKNSRL